MTTYSDFQLNRARALMPDILDALLGLLDEAKETSAFNDALAGEDEMMLDAVNAAEKVLAMVSGTPYTPHTLDTADGEPCEGDPRCWRVKYGHEYQCSCAEYRTDEA